MVWTKTNKYKKFIHLVSAVFQYAIRLDIVHDDPTKRILLPKFQSSKDNTLNYFNKTELKDFFDCLDSQRYPKRATFFRLIAFTGMRKGEAIALTWKDIDLKNHQITINKTIVRGEDAKLIVQSPKTRASNRTVDVDLKTISILKDWKKIQSKELSELGFKIKTDKNQLVFTNTKDGYLQPCYPQKWLKKVIDKYDMKHITVHGLRHTYATLAFEASASVKEVQEQLGHAEYKTTMDIYTAVTPKQKLETSKKFSNYVDF